MSGYKMYQTEWQGISLVEVAKKRNLPLAELAASDLYDEFYKTLKENHYSFSEGWLAQKQKGGRWLKELVDSEQKARGQKLKVLSIGCGLGVVEEELIKDGYDIALQECQSESFDYLRTKVPSMPPCYVTTDFSTIPSQGFDIVFTNQMLYCFDDVALSELVVHIHRLLKPQGLFVSGGEPQAWARQKVRIMLSKVKRMFVGGGVTPRVFWGYQRTAGTLKQMAREAGLAFIKELAFDADWNEVAAPGRIAGYLYGKTQATAQGMIFQKKDK